MKNLKLQALNAKYAAQKLEALATLEVYINNSAGIGEHPQIISEMDSLIRKIADADGCMQVINTTFSEAVEGPVGTSINS